MTKVENTMKDLSSYAKVALARIKGDKTEETVNFNEIKGRSAIQRQVADLTSAEADADMELKEANEALLSAIYPEERIASGTEAAKQYALKIAKQDEAVKNAEAKIEQIRDSIEFFNKLLAEKF